MAQTMRRLQGLQDIAQTVDIMRLVVVVGLCAGGHAIKQQAGMKMGEPAYAGGVGDIQLNEINAFRQLATASARTADADACCHQVAGNGTAEVAATDDQHILVQVCGSHSPCRYFSSQ